MLGIPLPIQVAVSANGIIPTAANGLRVGNVATAEDGHVEQRVISKYNGAPTLILDVNRVITADEIQSTATLRSALKEIEARYPAVHFDEVAAPADYTQKSLDGVMQSLIEGIALTAIVLMLFLHAWRNALVVMIAIPCSLLSTFIVMKLMHFTLDTISLMGLSLIIGILVDDSIVVLENITRHRELGQSPNDAALTGRGEIGGAAVAITLVDVVVFLPIAFLSGIVGKFLMEFGVVVVVATLFSLLVSFTLTPMLAARWSVKRPIQPPPGYLEWFQTGFERLTAWYRDRALPFALGHRWPTVGRLRAAVIQRDRVAGRRTRADRIRAEFQYRFDLDDALVSRRDADRENVGGGRPARSRDHEDSVRARNVDDGRQQAGGLRSNDRRVRRAHDDRTRQGSSCGDQRRRAANSHALAARAGRTAHRRRRGRQWERRRSDLLHALGSRRSDTQAGADKLAAFIRAIPGTVNVQTGAESDTNRLNITIDREKCALLGISPGAAVDGDAHRRSVARLQRACAPMRVSSTCACSCRRVRAMRLADIQNIKIRANDGISIYRLSDVATFNFAKAPTKIERRDKQRIARVTAGFDPGVTKLGTVTTKIQKPRWRQPGFNLPNGVALKGVGRFAIHRKRRSPAWALRCSRRSHRSSTCSWSFSTVRSSRRS